MKTILIAIPTNRYIEPETFKSIYDLIVPNEYKVTFQYFHGYMVDQVRNLIADWGKRYDYTLFVDSDMVLPPDTLQTLLNADKDIVSGVYRQRIEEEVILELYDEFGQNIPYAELKENEVIEISSCGMGCALVKGEVFRNIPWPHFYYTSAIDHSNTISEDTFFCKKAKEYGHSTFVHTGVILNHIGSTHFSVPKITPQSNSLDLIAKMDLLPADHQKYIKNMDIEPNIIYDIGACVQHWTRHAKKRWPNAQYYLFDAADAAKPYLGQDGADSYFSGVLTDQDGKEVNFYEKDDAPGGNSYYRETTGEYSESDIRIKKGWTLDTVVKNSGWSLPDLMKLDIQGAELDVLKGSPICLGHTKDIILEAQTQDYNEGAPKIDEIHKFLTNNGFELVSNFCKGYADGDYHYRRINSL